MNNILPSDARNAGAPAASNPVPSRKDQGGQPPAHTPTYAEIVQKVDALRAAPPGAGNIPASPPPDSGFAAPVDESGMTPAEVAALPLQPQQRTAIMKLTSGCGHAEAASAAGVSRMTLYRWFRKDPNFQAAFNAWQHDVLASARAQLLASTNKAMATVLRAVDGGDAKLAWKLLESQGVASQPNPGSGDAEEVRRRQSLEVEQQKLSEREQRSQMKQRQMLIPD